MSNDFKSIVKLVKRCRQIIPEIDCGCEVSAHLYNFSKNVRVAFRFSFNNEMDNEWEQIHAPSMRKLAEKAERNITKYSKLLEAVKAKEAKPKLFNAED